MRVPDDEKRALLVEDYLGNNWTGDDIELRVVMRRLPCRITSLP
jgi:hypothetical protein